MSEKKIKLTATELVAKQTADCREIKYKAQANMTEEELINKHTVGEYEDVQDDE